MKVLRFTFVFLLFCACQKASKAPVELTTAFEYLEKTMSDDDISELQSKEDKGFPPYYHELDIQGRLQSELIKNDHNWQLVNAYFDSHGIEKTTDKSGLIINMYQNYIANIDIDINDEIRIVDHYITPIMSCDSIQKKQAKHYLNHIRVNDIITVQMPVDEHENAIDYFCPNIDWTFISERDLELQVSVKNKIIDDALDLCHFEVKVLNMSNTFISILSEEIIEGDIIQIPVLTAWKLKPKS